jgi:TM2 domain-containing membrane protein YozV
LYYYFYVLSSIGSGFLEVLGILVNLFFPGVGMLIVGKIGQGVTQLLLYILGLVLIFTVVLLIFGIPLCLDMWVWSLVGAATARPNRN